MKVGVFEILGDGDNSPELSGDQSVRRRRARGKNAPIPMTMTKRNLFPTFRNRTKRRQNERMKYKTDFEYLEKTLIRLELEQESHDGETSTLSSTLQVSDASEDESSRWTSEGDSSAASVRSRQQGTESYPNTLSSNIQDLWFDGVVEPAVEASLYAAKLANDLLNSPQSSKAKKATGSSEREDLEPSIIKVTELHDVAIQENSKFTCDDLVDGAHEAIRKFSKKTLRLFKSLKPSTKPSPKGLNPHTKALRKRKEKTFTKPSPKGLNPHTKALRKRKEKYGLKHNEKNDQEIELRRPNVKSCKIRIEEARFHVKPRRYPKSTDDIFDFTDLDEAYFQDIAFESAPLPKILPSTSEDGQETRDSIFPLVDSEQSQLPPSPFSSDSVLISDILDPFETVSEWKTDFNLVPASIEDMENESFDFGDPIFFKRKKSVTFSSLKSYHR
jgi:hypothetical protein